MKKMVFLLTLMQFSIACSSNKDLCDFYINSKNGLKGDLYFFKGQRGEFISWTNDLWIEQSKFEFLEVSDTLKIFYLENNIQNEVFLKKKGGIRKIDENASNNRFLKISKKKAKKKTPSYISNEIFRY
ncbi:hypothetical protein ACFSKL_06880 [Belliella marina]|uniref:Lipoprotein n=1 Tax=Belliella marina TaxID=1644146 RepID=A0ABW4VLS6_9BACT